MSPALAGVFFTAEPPGKPRRGYKSGVWDEQTDSTTYKIDKHLSSCRRNYIQYLVITYNVKESEAKSDHIRLQKVIKMKYKRTS